MVQILVPLHFSMEFVFLTFDKRTDMIRIFFELLCKGIAMPAERIWKLNFVLMFSEQDIGNWIPYIATQ